jgi:predicted RNA-binding protein with PUA-like domain
LKIEGGQAFAWSPFLFSQRMPYLLKSEPEEYSFTDLERDGETVWDGVTNPVAVRHLREMKAGDKLVIYHTGKERQTVGTATVTSVDTKDNTPRVRIKAGKPLSQARTLAEIKENRMFADSPLVRQGRLSVVPLTDQQYRWLTEA